MEDNVTQEKSQHQLLKLAPVVAWDEMQVGRKALKWPKPLIAMVTVMILKMVEFLLIALESIEKKNEKF